jgi:hypothetical protein
MRFKKVPAAKYMRLKVLPGEGGGWVNLWRFLASQPVKNAVYRFTGREN